MLTSRFMGHSDLNWLPVVYLILLASLRFRHRWD